MVFWSSCGTEPFAVTMAAVKVKLATGTLTLQEHKAKFARKGGTFVFCIFHHLIDIVFIYCGANRSIP
jgi:hypothetical protein